ncbi:DUF1109 domain-containing protein [Methylosinus sp. H3A]|uniref:NrsF family protein n=1 Tax=Methylosinus sp. H3A TaxID=2785786 RepID=UPI0018C248FB|nr:DUF1109 domain-containing protein [Methylosinus sp. H3A]MBG0808037.1 DUF1109 domain-containing protein [Methylosinus sp. H3A]
MQTEELIRRLAENAPPVRRLAHPAWRAMVWFGLSLAYAAMVIYTMGPRSDIFVRLTELRFVIELLGALSTTVMAAAAAFCAGCPGRLLWERFTPGPFLFVWLASLGDGCWREWLRSGSEGLSVRFDFSCFPAILAISVAPAILIFVMIRRGAPIAPIATTGLATLAATALAAATLQLIHPQDASITVLIWQFGTVLTLTGIGALFGRRLLRWQAPDLRALQTREQPIQ